VKPLTLRARMFGSFMVFATVLVVVAGAAHYYETREALLELVDRDLADAASELGARRSLRQPLEAGVPALSDAGLHAFELYAIPSGVRVARSANLEGADDLIDRSSRAALASGSRSISLTRELPRVGRLRVHATRTPLQLGPSPRTGEDALVIVTAQDLVEVEDELRDVLAWSAATLGIALVLSGLAAWLTVRHLTRPLRDIAAAASRIESGGAAAAVPGSGANDEIDDLAGALERAFSRLKDAYDRQARFASDAAHELRTPVAAVRAQAEVASRRERTPDQYRLAMEQILEAATRMQQTLDALLLVARGDSDAVSVRTGRADLATVARDVVAAAESESRAGAVRLRVEAPDSAPLSGDARLLGILVRNLVDNAVAHSGSGGTVELTVVPDSAGVTLRVRDQGDGIPADALPHVFDRFFRVDASRSRATGGSGLGLSLVLLIAQMHGGTASADSAIGVGTTMTVRFPPATASARGGGRGAGA
jgi:two-component system heavy metal sensor histidine kinase CusS